MTAVGHRPEGATSQRRRAARRRLPALPPETDALRLFWQMGSPAGRRAGIEPRTCRDGREHGGLQGSHGFSWICLALGPAARGGARAPRKQDVAALRHWRNAARRPRRVQKAAFWRRSQTAATGEAAGDGCPNMPTHTGLGGFWFWVSTQISRLRGWGAGTGASMQRGLVEGGRCG